MDAVHRVLSQKTLSALIEASAAINASLDLQRTLEAIARSAAMVLGAEAASVLLLDRRRNKLVFKAAIGDRSDVLLGEEFDANLGIAGRVIASGRPTVVTDAQRDRTFFRGMDDKSSFTTRGLIAAPLIREGETIGVVEVLNKTGVENFNDQDVELMQVFANLAATAARNAQAHEQLRMENRGLRETARSGGPILGQSEALRRCLDLCTRVAGSNASVLLLGETGTGKEMMARHVHGNSSRRDKPFIAINCAALPETLLESELFGHEKGAFTGAVGQKAGRFELADNGTLFLDEIGDISLSTQVKLLRVLQEREFVRVGGTQAVSCDVRIIAATNRDLRTAMEKGQFREDLYYRLNVFPITLPPLRNRQEDIPLLVRHFVQKSAVDLRLTAPEVGDDAMALLTAYGWPGNIRELQNVMERAVLLADRQPISAAHLPREIVGNEAAPISAKGEGGLWGYEKAMIIKALNDCQWNQSKAARALGISRDNLRYRLKKYDIERPS